jgi:hexosaminidase
MPAVEVQKTAPGMKMKIAQGTFLKVKELDDVTEWIESTVAGDAKSINEHFSYKAPSAAVLTGYLDIPEDGIYEFSTDVDHLYIHDRLLINNEGQVRKHSRCDASIALGKGKHPVKIIFLNNIIGGWPQVWSGSVVRYRKIGDANYSQFSSEVLSF